MMMTMHLFIHTKQEVRVLSTNDDCERTSLFFFLIQIVFNVGGPLNFFFAFWLSGSLGGENT